MKVYHSLSSFKKPSYAVVTGGTFDGVHLGHQKILHRLKEIRAEKQGETVVITFWPHPRIVLSHGSSDLKLLSTIDEKIELLEKQGIDNLLILPFTEDFAQLSPDEYIRQVYIQGIGTQKLIIGYDHRFGKNREGGLDFIQKNRHQYGFDIEEISRQDIDNVGISSTKIRNALQAGDIHLANQYLGYFYTISGIVVQGDKLGRTLGFPTANMEVFEKYKLIPADGVYAVKIHYQQLQKTGMLYIGNRPTLQGIEKRIEVNIFDFEEDIYGQTLKIRLVEKIRGDEKFDSLESMKHQLEKDKIQTIHIFSQK
jgi:riboflavin kinase / FMN adenylyltransferase